MLVGAGSYGRVFAGKLGTQDVAIKVLHHDDATAQEVASEVGGVTRLGRSCSVKVCGRSQQNIAAEKHCMLAKVMSFVCTMSIAYLFVHAMPVPSTSCLWCVCVTSVLPWVLLQVAMMMRFKHTNLVKAYHYITWGTAGLSNRLTCPVSQHGGLTTPSTQFVALE